MKFLKCIFLNGNNDVLFQLLVEFVYRGPIDNMSLLGHQAMMVIEMFGGI